MSNQFPEIPGVEFRYVPRFEGYAVSSDRRVWNGRRGHWRVMETYTFCDGEEAVFLLRPKSAGGKMFKIEELMLLFEPQ